MNFYFQYFNKIMYGAHKLTQSTCVGVNLIIIDSVDYNVRVGYRHTDTF